LSLVTGLFYLVLFGARGTWWRSELRHRATLYISVIKTLC
jgi:hypothetical protein